MYSFNKIQPTFIKANESTRMPNNLVGKCFLSINIGYNFTSGQSSSCGSGSGSGSYESLNNLNLLGVDLEGYDDYSEIASVEQPKIYVLLSKEVLDVDIIKFIRLCMDNSHNWHNGIKNFKPGVNYFINDILNSRLKTMGVVMKDNMVLPNIVIDDEISNNWTVLSLIDTLSLHFANQNTLLDLTFDEDELKAFYCTFCNLIKTYSTIDNETRAAGQNPIYECVLNYFVQHKSDEASKGIGLILNTLFATSQTKTGCGCNTVVSETTQTSSCSDLYSQAMLTYLINMLGNYEFYNDWFRTIIRDEETDEIIDIIPNDALIEKIRLLFNEFKKLGYNLSFKKSVTKNCDCPNVSIADDSCNQSIMTNYLYIMDFVQNNEIESHKNNIKVYGEQFGNLLPKLEF